VEILNNLLSEPAIKLIWGVEKQTFALGTFFAASHQGIVLVTFEQAWDLRIGQ
jgi:hypothetical protein